jgi:hypothetical protein
MPSPNRLKSKLLLRPSVGGPASTLTAHPTFLLYLSHQALVISSLYAKLTPTLVPLHLLLSLFGTLHTHTHTHTCLVYQQLDPSHLNSRLKGHFLREVFPDFPYKQSSFLLHHYSLSFHWFFF